MRPTRQKEIIDAARMEFAEKGYGAASIRDIAQRCGMSMSALYHYYPGKQDLLKAILDEGVESYFGACERALAKAGPDPAERLEVLVEATVRFRADHPVKSGVLAEERSLRRRTWRPTARRKRAARSSSRRSSPRAARPASSPRRTRTTHGARSSRCATRSRSGGGPRGR